MRTEPSKTKVIIPIVLILACAGLAGWAWTLQGQLVVQQKVNDDLQAKLAKYEQRAKADATQVAMMKATTPLRTAAAGAAADQADAANSARKRNLNPEQVAAIVKNPAMQSIIASQQTALLQMTYRDLMDKLQLSPEERDYMSKLLVQKQMDKINIGSQFLNPALSADDKTALGQQFMAAQTADDDNLHSFLNSDADFAAYQSYSQQEPERLEVGMVETALAGSSAPLDASTSDALVSLLDNTRQNFQFTVDFNNESTFANPALLTAPNVNKFLDEETSYQAQIADKAAAILNPAQLEAFKQNQAATMQMTRQKLNSVLQLSGAAQ